MNSEELKQAIRYSVYDYDPKTHESTRVDATPQNPLAIREFAFVLSSNPQTPEYVYWASAKRLTLVSNPDNRSKPFHYRPCTKNGISCER